MQRYVCRSPLYFRLIISLLLSISASLLLISITNQQENSYFFTDERTTIADRIVLVVRTSHNCQSRLTYLLQSWISPDQSKQSNLYLTTDNLSTETNSTIFNSFRHVIETHCPTTHDVLDLCCKTAHEFELFYNLTTTKTNLEWLCRFDDDQYVNVNNLYKYLSQFDASKPYYIGRTSVNKRWTIRNDTRTYVFATYGAGVCFSYALLDKLRPHVHVDVLPRSCVTRRISDDAYIGYLSEVIVNVSLTTRNDLFHSHLEVLDKSFRTFSLNDLTNMITFGFAWDRYQLDWQPIIHQLIQLVNQEHYEAANRLWLFLRNYEKQHPENLTDQYDQSCTSYQQQQRRRNQAMLLKTKTTVRSIKQTTRKN